MGPRYAAPSPGCLSGAEPGRCLPTLIELWVRATNDQGLMTRDQPAQRADHLRVLVAERPGGSLGKGEGYQELVPGGAGDEVVVPDHAEVPFPTLDADL